jgi:hypothetical protein
LEAALATLEANMIDPAKMSVDEIEAELATLAPQLAEAYATGSRATVLEARNWRLSAELRYRDRDGRSTYFAHAGDVELEMGGRFAKVLPTTVVGSEPVVKYPKLPEGSPWAKDECPPEPGLGIDVNAMEALGEPHEQAASHAGDAGVPPSVARSFKRRI